MVNKLILAAILSTLPLLAYAEHDTEIELDEISVSSSGKTDSRIRKHPATVETYDKKQIEDNVNAVTAAQTLKYLPSIQVRERYIGDRNGIIATRTIGTLSSAQSMLYADGVLLSNLLGNSFAFPPRWGMVSPEEIESISMMYGPFSSIYAGNSFGGVMSIKTRMPTKFEAHANVQAFRQDFKLYGTDKHYDGRHLSASIGDKVGGFSFWLGADHLENQGQPMNFSTRGLSTTAPGASPIVTSAFQDKDVTNNDRVIFGATGIDKTRQDQVKLKVAYDITPELNIAYTLGVWDLSGKTDVQTYLKDTAGNSVYNGRVNYNGNRYDVSGMTPGETESLHTMQAVDLKSNTGGFYDWQLTLSDYDYHKDLIRTSNAPSNGTVIAGNPYLNRIGRVDDLSGTGWTVFDARATLRPNGHELDVGYHIDHYKLKSTRNDTTNWTVGDKGALTNLSRGETQTQALFVQDKWQINPEWALNTGVRAEHWEAKNGRNQTGNAMVDYQQRSDIKISPKLSVSYEPQPAWGFRASVGQAYRFPTVSELFQPLQNGDGGAARLVESNPNLKPEEVIAIELTAERRFDNGLLRVSLFNEEKYDALISQTLTNGSAIPYDTGVCDRNAGCSFVQNIDHVRTTGIELATDWQDVLLHGLDFMGSLTLTDSEIIRNKAAPDTEGNQSLRIPRSMIKMVATYHHDDKLTYSVAARYSGRQFGSLNNADRNGDTFGGVSKFFVVDVKANYKFAQYWTASVGVDNINNYKSYVFHPYPQRTGYVQVKVDY